MLEVIIGASAGISAALVAIISTTCWNVRRLRCNEISCCGAHCNRVIMTAEDMKLDTLKTNPMAV